MGPVLDLAIASVNKYGGFVTWHPPQCNSRNGKLLHYAVNVYKLPGNQIVVSDVTNDTLYEISGVSPYTRYGVSVVYVNSRGAGPSGVTLAEFNTTEDGRCHWCTLGNFRIFKFHKLYNIMPYLPNL